MPKIFRREKNCCRAICSDTTCFSWLESLCSYIWHGYSCGRRETAVPHHILSDSIRRWHRCYSTTKAQCQEGESSIFSRQKGLLRYQHIRTNLVPTNEMALLTTSYSLPLPPNKLDYTVPRSKKTAGNLFSFGEPFRFYGSNGRT